MQCKLLKLPKLNGLEFPADFLKKGESSCSVFADNRSLHNKEKIERKLTAWQEILKFDLQFSYFNFFQSLTIVFVDEYDKSTVTFSTRCMRCSGISTTYQRRFV